MAFIPTLSNRERNVAATDQGTNKQSSEPDLKLLEIDGPASSFWGLDPGTVRQPPLRINAERSATRGLFCDRRLESWENIGVAAIMKLLDIFNNLDCTLPTSENPVAKISLSTDLEKWRQCQHDAGRILPSKGRGLTRASQEVIEMFEAQDWPPALLTNGALFGCGFGDMLVGAHDPKTLYSNYCNDMGFYFEHGYHKIFPEFEALVQQASEDPYALHTLGGRERRVASAVALNYTKTKMAFEELHKANLSYKTARLNRREALLLHFCDSEIWGVPAEAIARGFDETDVIMDFVCLSPSTDVVDVGSDIHNSELLNSFLNTTDITESGVVSEEALRRVYDAYAHSCAKIYTERYLTPSAKANATLFTWHILNNRHALLRRIVLGYSKARKTSIGQFEADLCEAFDEDFRATGFSRPLERACNGEATCDQMDSKIRQHPQKEILADLWWLLSIGLVESAAAGVVCGDKEKKITETSSMPGKMLFIWAGGRDFLDFSSC